MEYQSMICEVCGGASFIEKDDKLICLYCDTTYEKISEVEDEEERAAREAFNRAEQKLDCSPPRFDEAEDEFSNLIKKYPTWSVGYWGLVRAKYGIKYETDFDGKLIPSCYKSEYCDFREDSNFKKAVQYAESEERREKYVSEGNRISETCAEWTNEAGKYSYDIFISFKASDDHGRETKDLYEMQNLYTYLTDVGYKVFFSPVSMRLYTGKNYDAYIFNALDKAKVMIVYGSNHEYFSTTWVQNEWTRYLRMMARGHKQPGSLIVAYDKFNPNELPRQLRSLQAVNASDKIFYITLSETIKKIINPTEKTSQSQEKSENVSDASEQDKFHTHTYSTKIIAPTCVAKGYTLHKCNCGHEYKDQYTALTDHQYVKTEEISATCNTEGKIKYSCDVCGEVKEEKLEPIGHNFSDWTESSSPTCIKEGVKIRKCGRCGYIETKVVPPSGHTFGEWIFSGVAASKEKRRICSKCGYTEIVPISDTPDSNKKTSEKFKRNWKKLNIWLFLSLAFLTIGALLSNNTRVLVDGVPLYPFMGKVGGISTLFFEILRIIRISNAKNVDKYILLSCKKTEGFASVASFIVFLLLAATEELYSGSEIYDSIAVLGSFAFVHAVFALICSAVAKSKAKKTQVNSGNKSQNNTASNVSRNTANKSSEYIEFYINTLKNTAAKQGSESITIDSNKVYTVFNAHTEKAVIVASMKKIMRNHDRIIFESPTSIVIQYFVK